MEAAHPSALTATAFAPQPPFHVQIKGSQARQCGMPRREWRKPPTRRSPRHRGLPSSHSRTGKVGRIHCEGRTK
jgi:hypothetical protein